MSSRTAFVTGASRGIGRACAISLAAAGHPVVLAARDLAKLESVAEEIRAAGGTAFVAAMDLSSEESIRAAFKQATSEAGPITVLVNNAGITRDGLSMRMKREDWDAVLHTNLTGSFLCIQQVMPGMMKERWGRIVNISSVVGESARWGAWTRRARILGEMNDVHQRSARRHEITIARPQPGHHRPTRHRPGAARTSRRAPDRG